MGGKVKNPKEYYANWREKHKSQIKLASKKYYEKIKANPITREEAKRKAKKYRVDNIEKDREKVRRYYYSHHEAMKTRSKPRQDAIKLKVLTHYGNGKTACIRCGFDDLRALSLDHINGGGYQHRKQVGSGIHLYNWIIKNEFPEGFQTLCMNCQFIKRAVEKECTGAKH